MCFRNNTAAEGSNPSRFRFIDITRSAMKRVAAMFVERVFCEKKGKERKGKERKEKRVPVSFPRRLFCAS